MLAATVRPGGEAGHRMQAADPVGLEPTRTGEAAAVSERVVQRTATTAQPRDPDRYHILGEHGRGGLGRVSRAHDRDLGRDVAIKELISRGNVSEIRFLREALITARLEHPGIVPVHEAGRWPDGTPFYAMKLVAGRSLRDLIAERDTVAERHGLLHHVIAVADAIAYAHGRNIIHRDLKPANVIVGDFGETIVIDWGLAKDLSAADEDPLAAGPFRAQRDDGLTATGSVLGTPAYMAPEQERGEHVDQRADVFAIGTMLWELCSLHKTPPTDPSIRHRMLRRAGIDRDLITIIDKALDPDRARRYPAAGALAADLKAFKAGVRISARSYSLFAMLAHWTRHHRALALSVNAAIAIAVVGSVLYVRDVAAERNRADAALVISQHERDRAQLSEAALLLEKDPAAAKAILTSRSVDSAQHALLLSRASTRASTHTIPIREGVEALFHAPDSQEVAMLTREGELYRLDVGSARLTRIDTLIGGAVARYGTEWIYARTVREGDPPVVTTSSTRRSFNTQTLAQIRTLTVSGATVHALDANGALYELSERLPRKLRTGVHRIAENDHATLICMRDGTLDITEGTVTTTVGRCAQTRSPATLAVNHRRWADHTSDGHLRYAREGRLAEVATGIRGDVELALSDTGLIAVADYDGNKTWYVKADDNELLAGPLYASSVYSVVVDGNVAAWGYADGTIIVHETTTGTEWALKGHPVGASNVVLQPQTARVVSTSERDLRVWDLQRPVASRVAKLPCKVFHARPSADGTDVALDCSDGSVRTWSPRTGIVQRVHAHAQRAVDVTWIGRRICSGGVDGHVLCSDVDTRATQDLFPNRGQIMWITSNPSHPLAVFSTVDGTVWSYHGTLRRLYTHAGVTYRGAISPDGQSVASCGLDGSLIVFDLRRETITFHGHVHAGAIHNVEWANGSLWTSGVDGTMKRWDLGANGLRLRTVTWNATALRVTRTFPGGWASHIGDDLVIHREGEALTRLTLGRSIYALAASSDGHYLAASTAGEVAVVDLTRRAVATIVSEPNEPGFVGFADDSTLLYGAPAALWKATLRSVNFIPHP
ncbi:MAG: protein kinase [Myxococcales bacterium]|nr:protein kinase [Myxococcales bacterium]